ncbi:MAG: iron ABC transporter permease [Ponticaulis sp.]|nr:iron ABC transporter permease [Ponticaulis sp.]
MAIALIVLAGLLMLPVLGVLVGSFGESDGTWNHIRETVLTEYLLHTLGLLMIVGVLTAGIGTGAAWIVSTLNFPGRKLLEWLLVLPIASPAYIIAYVYTDLLEFAGPVQTSLRHLTGWGANDYWFPEIRSLQGAGIVLASVLYPYVYLITRSAFLNQSQTRFHAARSLGASPFRAFWSVALPSARAAIIAGVALALMETAADFGVSDYFGITTFSTGIYRAWYGMGDPVSSLRLAGCLLFLVAAILVIERVSRANQGGNAIARDVTVRRMTPGPFSQFICFLACALPVLIGFVIPVGTLAILAFGEGFQAGVSEFLRSVSNSLTLSVIISILTLGISLFLAYAQRGRTRNDLSRFSGAATRLATLGYALPGTLLAVGLLLPLIALDKSISRLAQDFLGVNPGLVLTGSIATLIYACTIRFLTVSYNTVEPAVNAIPRAVDEAARTLGSRLSRIVYEIHLPGLKPALYSAALLVFIDTMRELPATLLLRPFNFETLATRVYRLASDERLSEASISALALVLIGLIPVILINKVSRSS